MSQRKKESLKTEKHLNKNLKIEFKRHFLYGNRTTYSWLIPCILAVIFFNLLFAECHNTENVTLYKNIQLTEEYLKEKPAKPISWLRQNIDCTYTKTNYLIKQYDRILSIATIDETQKMISEMDFSTEDDILNQVYTVMNAIPQYSGQVISEENSYDYLYTFTLYEYIKKNIKVGMYTEITMQVACFLLCGFAIMRIVLYFTKVRADKGDKR